MHPDITCVLTMLIVGATMFGAAEVAHAQDVDSILSRCFPNGTPPIPRLKSARADRAMNTARSSVERFSSKQPLPADVLSRYRKHAAEMCRGTGSVSQSVRGRMHRILRRLRRHAPLSAQRVPITFELAHAEELNAFMGVGGQGCLHDSLFKKLPEDGAIAMIMAHEMGHAIHGHVERKLRLQQAIKHESKAKLKSGYEFAKGKAGEYLRKRGLGTLVEKASDTARKAKKKTDRFLERNPGVGRAADGLATFTTTVAAKLTTMVFDQEEEYEADRMGLCLIRLAGYEPAHAKRFFELVNRPDQTTTRESSWRAFVRSHPVAKERLAYLDDLMRELK